MSKYSVNSTRTCYCPPLVTAQQMMREKACVENAHQGLILILLKYHSHYEEKKRKEKKNAPAWLHIENVPFMLQK